MNYTRIYNAIIFKATSSDRKRSDGVYYEQHHILPKCLGGNNDTSNLVLLTAREHFICHHLLVKIHPNNRRLIHAFWLMCNTKNRHQSMRYVPSSSVYQEARELNAKAGVSNDTRRKMSESHAGSKKTVDTKQKISKANSKPKERVQCPHCLKITSVGPNSSRWHFDNCKSKIGNEAISRKSANTGIIVQCTHCEKAGGVNVMHRWHFDNCKNKINLVTTK